MFATTKMPETCVIISYTHEESEVIFKKILPKPRQLFSYWDKNKRVYFNGDTYYLFEFEDFAIKGTSLDKIYISNNLTPQDALVIIERLYPTLKELSKDNVIYK